MNEWISFTTFVWPLDSCLKLADKSNGACATEPCMCARCRTQAPSPNKDNRCVCISGGAYVCHMPSLRAQSGCQERGLNLRLEMGAVRSQGADAWHREIGFGKDRSNEARGRKATAKSSLRIWCPPPYPLNIIQFGRVHTYTHTHKNGDMRRRKRGLWMERERKEKQRGGI